jgi:hypothetical protein
VVIYALILWFVVGPGPVRLAQYSSAWGAGVSTDPEAGPFDGHLLLSLALIAQIQTLRHMRLPFVLTMVVLVVFVIMTVCVAPPVMQAAAPTVPASFVRGNVFAFLLGVLVNALTAAVSSYSWELRCRAQLLTVAASSAAERDSKLLLCNLMPPSVVTAITSGQQVVPVCANNVVILVRDILKSQLVRDHILRSDTRLLKMRSSVFCSTEILLVLLRSQARFLQSS